MKTIIAIMQAVIDTAAFIASFVAACAILLLFAFGAYVLIMLGLS